MCCAVWELSQCVRTTKNYAYVCACVCQCVCVCGHKLSMQLSALATASASASASASVAAWSHAGKYATPMRRSVQMPRNQKLLSPPPPPHTHTHAYIHFSSVHCPPTYICMYVCLFVSYSCPCSDILFVRSQNLKTSLHKTTHTHTQTPSLYVCVCVYRGRQNGLIYSQAGPNTALIINFNLIT